MSVVGLVSTSAFEDFHVGAFLVMGFITDDGIRLAHRDPSEKEAVWTIHGGISGAVGEVDAASIIAKIGTAGGSRSCTGMEKMVFAKVGKARGADRPGFGIGASVPDGEDFGSC